MWIITVLVSVVFGVMLEYIVSVNGSSTQQ